jgi:hypothetical protein
MEALDLVTIYRSGFAITPNDGTDLATQAKAIWVGGTGAIKVTTADDSTLTFAAVPVGFFPVRCKRVWSTGTTATNLIGVR